MKPIRVLIVEDSEDDMLFVLRALRQAGFEPEHVRVQTPGQLRNALAQQTWDCIISDYSLPSFSGLDALNLVRSTGIDVPFVIVSGAIGEDTAVDAMRAGAHDYIMKGNLTRLAPAIERELVEAQIRKERREAENALRLAASVFDNSMEGIMITDPKARIVRVNQAFCDMTGFSVDEVIGNTPQLLGSGRHTAPFFRQMWRSLQDSGYWRGEIQNRRKNGEIFPAWLTISSVRDDMGEVSHYIGSLIDLSVQRKAEERVRYLTQYDALTDLPNRALLREKLKSAILRAGYLNREIVYLQFDLDRFTRINDTLGHHHGDRILQRVSQRLRQHTSENDIVARLGGDEFAVVLVDLDREAKLEEVTQKLADCLKEPFVLGSRELFLTASIGVARYPQDTRDADALIKYADRALHQAKLSGGMRQYSPTMDADTIGQMHMEGALRRALEREEFVVHYQPQVDFSNGRVVGAEALLRWSRGERWLVPPNEFLPVLEETGLINKVTEWMLERVCMDFRAWRDLGATIRTVSVNLSAKQFWHPDLADQIGDTLLRTGVDASCLCLEISERYLTEDASASSGLLKRLREMGVRIAIDNFGSRYSSLSLLRKFPLDILKIDRSFIETLPKSDENEAIIDGIIAMAHPLNLKIVAEGIERASQYQFLQSHGIDIAQGFFCGRPQEINEFTHLVATNHNQFSPAYSAAPHLH